MLSPLKDLQDGIIEFFEYLKGNKTDAKKLNISTLALKFTETVKVKINKSKCIEN